MKAPAGCQLTGRWRSVEADLWDRDYLDLSGPATIIIGEDINGEIAFGAATRPPSKPTGMLLQQPARAADGGHEKKESYKAI